MKYRQVEVDEAVEDLNFPDNYAIQLSSNVREDETVKGFKTNKEEKISYYM